MSGAPPPAALEAAIMLDADHPAVRNFAAAAIGDAQTPRERAIKLYYAVRDNFRYDPYKVDLSIEGLRASRVLADGSSWCVPKAALLAASCRAAGIPARVGYADVRNHLSTARLREMMGSDIFRYHGYAAIFLGDTWVKATPAFNIGLCQKLGLQPLEFDGTADSINHEFDLAGRRHMEYLAYHGEFDDVPRDTILGVFAKYYPNLPRLDTADWEQDIAAERAP